MNIAFGKNSKATGIYNIAVGDDTTARGAFQIVMGDKLSLSYLSPEDFARIKGSVEEFVLTAEALSQQKFAPTDFGKRSRAVYEYIIPELEKQLKKRAPDKKEVEDSKTKEVEVKDSKREVD